LSAKDSKKKEELKEFTVGSVSPSGTGKTKKPAATGPKVEISEKEYPVLASLIKGNGVDDFKSEVGRVLGKVQESATGDKDLADKVQKAYAMGLAIVDNGKVVK
jgi:hypothetical protein